MRGRGGGIDVSSTDLYKLTKDLQQVDKKLATAMKARMREVAEPIRKRVADEAAWSRRIPKATKVSTRFTARTQAVIVTVNRKQAPHARPLENAGRAGTFTHPLFGRTRRITGRRLLVKQQARPFFAKAIRASDHRIDAAIEQVARDFERAAGFR